MAYFKFANMYFDDEPIHIYNDGDFENDMYRDFTYVSDIVEGITKLMDTPPAKSEEEAAHAVYNIGNSEPVKLMDFITALEQALSHSLDRDVEFEKIYEPIKPGGVPATYASTEKLQEAVGYKPDTTIQEELQQFTDWSVDYYDVELFTLKGE